MSNFTPSGGVPTQVTGNTNTVSAPYITNTALALANTEYSVVIPVAAKRFLIRSRLGGRLQISYVAAQTGITFLTIPSGNVYTEKFLERTLSLTLYVQSSKATDTLELLYWE